MSSLIDQITVAYKRDQQRNAMAVKASDLPISYEAITDEWLTDVLCQAHPGAKVSSHTLGSPDTGTSNRRRIHVEYNARGQAAGLPTTLFCKATHDLASRIVLGVAGSSRAEVLFYNSVRSLLDIEAPNSYFANHDAESCNSIILLEDLSFAGVQFCSHLTPITRQRAESQLKLLAHYHGRFYQARELDTVLKALPTWPQYLRKTLDMGMKEGSNHGFLAAEEVIPATLYQRYDAIWPATMASVDQHNNLPHTLSHGDVHLKNWYVSGNGEMGLSDWQCSTRAHWSRDFAYTLSTSLSVEDRRVWEQELLRFYLDLMAQAGATPIPFDDAWNAYRLQLMSALTWWTITLCPAPGMPQDMQPRDITLEFIRRISTAIDDLDSLAVASSLA